MVASEENSRTRLTLIVTTSIQDGGHSAMASQALLWLAVAMTTAIATQNYTYRQDDHL
jgi:hypothetical protein